MLSTETFISVEFVVTMAPSAGVGESKEIVRIAAAVVKVSVLLMAKLSEVSLDLTLK